jgi:decaprenylphospho-beta-D-ribofuranose 2-oxidase
MMLAGWGRFPRHDCRVSRPEGEDQLRDLVGRGRLIARGNGRAYGDAALSPTNTVDMRGFDRMLDFDPATGRLVVEAGVLLADVIAAFLPRGWFPAVTPGTRFVTVGGMAAADVHGKNHHRDGSFGATVDWLDVMGPDGSVTRCSADREAGLFRWTLGGMGLTGVILRVAFRLRPVESAWIRQTLLPAADLDAAMGLIEAHGSATYSVAWVDCLGTGARVGRSLVMLGEHAVPADLPPEGRAAPFAVPSRRSLAVPFDLPGFALNAAAMRAFNALYHRNGLRNAGRRLVDWETYFYPLDRVGHWNRIYGRGGLVQFQCALPLARAADGLRRLLEATSAAGQGSFLAVLKRFGPQDGGFSFPMEGYTLALDFPVRRPVLDLLARLDAIVLDHGGRFYLAKDGRMARETLAATDPRAAAFRAVREASGAARAFASAQSERLGL